MTIPTLVIRHICFTGPGKSPAMMSFAPGFNLLYGASETGKSFVLEAIDYMLGGSRNLRDIRERTGYDQVLLGLSSNGHSQTLVRSATGGHFRQYEGLHTSVPDNTESIVLQCQHSADRNDSVSQSLLREIGLEGKWIRKNQSGATKSLSFRDLAHLCLVSETDIQKTGSPVEGNIPQQRTAEFSVFKLLLSGLDDSSVVSSLPDASVVQSRRGRLDMIDELLRDLREQVGDEVDQRGLKEQFDMLQVAIQQEQQGVADVEQKREQLIERKRSLEARLRDGIDRRREIDELAARFELLKEHYESDLARLEGIREAGSMLTALSPQVCPLCGADPSSQHLEGDCAGNTEVVVRAAEAESAKIDLLRRELQDTIRRLLSEAESFDRLIPGTTNAVRALTHEIEELRPLQIAGRATYAELFERRAGIQRELSIWSQIVALEDRYRELDEPTRVEAGPQPMTNGAPSAILDAFAKSIEALLVAWDFPNAERVHFSETDRDLIISGARRGSRGKGLRAITHAAFTIGLLEYCRERELPHPGFVVLDSPLLAYREPEGQEDDLSGTEVQKRFYEYLMGLNDRQVIIIENTDPPAEIQSGPTSVFFSKNPHQGRYGFFPALGSPQTD